MNIGAHSIISGFPEEFEKISKLLLLQCHWNPIWYLLIPSSINCRGGRKWNWDNIIPASRFSNPHSLTSIQNSRYSSHQLSDIFVFCCHLMVMRVRLLIFHNSSYSHFHSYQLLLFNEDRPTNTTDISIYKSQAHVPLHESLQRIRACQRPCTTSRELRLLYIHVQVGSILS